VADGPGGEKGPGVMIPLHDFEFHSPRTLDGALDLLEKYRGEVKILAGGTDLVVAMKHGLNRPRHLLWPGKVGEMGGIEQTADGSLRIGAMSPLGEIASHPLVLGKFPGLSATVREIASPQIRNRATIGGNLCINTRCFYYDHSVFWREALCGCLKLGTGNGGAPAICHAGPGLGVCAAVFFSDMAPVLIALGATVEIRSRDGTRAIPLSGLYSADGCAHLTLAPEEMLTSVTVPAQPENSRLSRMKMGARGTIDFPIVSVAAALEFDRSGACVAGRIVIGAVETRPGEFPRGMEMLIGSRPDSERSAAIAKEAAAAVTPFPNAYESVGYRKKMVEVLVRRCLTDAAAQSRPAGVRGASGGGRT